MGYDLIPSELRAYNQWIIWRAEETVDGKPTKIPYQSLNPGQLASVIDPSHWSTFDQAVAAAASNWASGIGFVFTRECPFTGIDLDESTDLNTFQKQKEIYEAFQTYSELSPSGKGLHLICRGKVPVGRRFKKIEIYPHGRFFTMTGNVYQVPRPIEDRQHLLTILYDEVKLLSDHHTPMSHQGDAPETASDREIYDMAVGAINGERFFSLWNGHWQETIDARTNQPYESQSEADLALMNMIGFYSQNADQMVRLFKQSALGWRPKANRADYMGWLVSKAFDQLPPPINLEMATNTLREEMTRDVRAELTQTQALPIAIASPYTAPPGLMGKIAEWCYNAAPRPVPEIALAAAIGLMAGLCGRAYNVIGTGLNHYIALIGTTGVGKEAMASSIDRLMTWCAAELPSIRNYQGPAELASGQALVRLLEKQPCVLTIMGEFGYKLQAFSSDRANPADIMLKRILLDLYGKSGAQQSYHPIMYSDTAKNTIELHSPAFTLLCEGTPTSFYSNINERMIEDGLLPRFTVIEYLGQRVPDNEKAHTIVPSKELIKEVNNLVMAANMIMSKKEAQVCIVERTDEAIEFIREFNRYADRQINTAEVEVTKGLWTRAYVKVCKLAALVAVGVDWHKPVMTLDMAKWAQGIIVHEIGAFMQRFNAGDIGTAAMTGGRNETAQVRDVARLIIEYLTKDYVDLKTYRINADFHANHVIPLSYLSQRVNQLGSFKNDRSDNRTVLNRSLQYLIDTQFLTKINTRSADWQRQFGTKGLTANLYFVLDFDKIKEVAGRR